MMNIQETTLEVLVDQAQTGSKQALEEIIRQIQDDIYRLSIKMLSHPEDAQDATQEILIRVITHLSSFRKDSAFKTWVYRIAANYLLTMRKRRAEQCNLTFDEFSEDLYEGLSDDSLPGSSEVEQRLLVEEVKLSCTQAMLLCLDRAHRITYILGEIFELTGEQGGSILEITPTAFRKRLSRARASIQGFMQQNCGLINKNNGCRCWRRVHRAIELHRMDPNHLLLATHPTQVGQEAILQQSIQEMETLEYTAARLHRQPEYAAPGSLLQSVKSLVDSGKYQIFE